MIRSYTGISPVVPASCFVDDSAQIIGDVTLGELVTHVLVHEIGHHFGMSDADMEAIEASAE